MNSIDDGADSCAEVAVFIDLCAQLAQFPQDPHSGDAAQSPPGGIRDAEEDRCFPTYGARGTLFSSYIGYIGDNGATQKLEDSLIASDASASPPEDGAATVGGSAYFRGPSLVGYFDKSDSIIDCLRTSVGKRSRERDKVDGVDLVGGDIPCKPKNFPKMSGGAKRVLPMLEAIKN